MILTVGGLKGGVGKSTSAAFLASGLARQGRALLVDADPQGSLLAWSEEAGDTFPPVVAWPVRDLGRRVAQVATDYQHVVIDTGPSQEQLLRQALTVSDAFLIPAAPSLIDVREVARTLQLPTSDAFPSARRGGRPSGATLLGRRSPAVARSGATASHVRKRSYVSQSEGSPLLEVMRAAANHAAAADRVARLAFGTGVPRPGLAVV